MSLTECSLLAVVAGFLLTSHLAIAADSKHEWGYPNLENEEAFPKWGGKCDQGRLQSPIDLSIRGSLKGMLPNLKLTNYDASIKGAKIVNNGHTVQLLQFPKKTKIQGGPLFSSYVVEQLHFHWWSEHTINNIRYPLEMHIVHRDERYSNISEALKHKNGVAVLGVLYHVSNEGNDAVEKIAEHLDEIRSSENVNKPIDVEEDIELGDLIPDTDTYITYEGSLTTPSCDESVKWIVMLETLPVTMEQISLFDDIENHSGVKLKNNYREIQKGHNRAVIVVLGDDKSGASINSLPTLTILLSAISFLGVTNFLK